ncbi:MAG TPA: DMT family transporter [Symbiobacteriaceae bacterium]|nr:DMT family transporter [Symbiobacteriaceae bacterium]
MNRWMAAGWLLLANALWGTSFVVVKVSLEQLPPPLLGALRFLIASALLWGIIYLQRRLRPQAAVQVARQDAWRIFGLGVVVVAVTHLISNFGQSLTTATDASLMIIGEVIFTTVLGALILGERPSRWKKIGAAVGAVGAVTLILSGARSSGDGAAGLVRAAGDLLFLLGLMGEALYSILGAKYVRRYSALTVTALVNTGSLVIWIPVLIWYIASGRFPWGASWMAYAGVVYLAVINSVVCFLIWFMVLRSAPANFGAISLFAQPLVGSVLGVTLLGDRVTAGLVAGGVMVLLALLCATLPEKGRAASPGSQASA